MRGLSCIIAAGLGLAWAPEGQGHVGQVVARGAVLVQVAPGQHGDLVDRAQQAERAGSTGCCRPPRDDTPAHGRLVAEPRLRLRQATATRHWPVATAMAAWPTTPQPAPPP